MNPEPIKPQMMELISRLVDVPSTDSEDARRRRLLNVLILCTVVLVLLGLLAAFLLDIGKEEAGLGSIYRTGGILLAGLSVVAVLNRAGSGVAAAGLFLALFTIILFYDTPDGIVDGGNLLLLAIPILVADILLHPLSGFVVAVLVSMVHVVAANRAGVTPDYLALAGYFAIALLSWLSSRRLERALAELRSVNRALDRRVKERTIDLAEALAREHAEADRNQTILESIADGVIVFDGQDVAVLANKAISQLLEVPQKALIGQDIREIMANRVTGEEQAVILQLMEEKSLSRPAIKIDWGGKTLSVSFARVHSQTDGSSGIVAVFRDFTGEAEIDRMKSDFVSIASHELRSPLTAIMGYLDLVIQEGAGSVSPQQEQFLTIARDNAGRLYELVYDLLELSHIESGQIELDVQSVTVKGLVDTAAENVARQFTERKLTLTRDVPKDLPPVFVDPQRIVQVLINLMSNAYKYTPAGGATVRARQVENAVQIDVVDTGLGISEADQEKLFSRFFRSSDPAVLRQPGTGLGLSITSSLVQMHGGRIWAHSNTGVGTTMSFTLPLPDGEMIGSNLPEAKV